MPNLLVVVQAQILGHIPTSVHCQTEDQASKPSGICLRSSDDDDDDDDDDNRNNHSIHSSSVSSSQDQTAKRRHHIPITTAPISRFQVDDFCVVSRFGGLGGLRPSDLHRGLSGLWRLWRQITLCNAEEGPEPLISQIQLQTSWELRLAAPKLNC